MPSKFNKIRSQPSKDLLKLLADNFAKVESDPLSEMEMPTASSDLRKDVEELTKAINRLIKRVNWED